MLGYAGGGLAAQLAQAHILMVVLIVIVVVLLLPLPVVAVMAENYRVVVRRVGQKPVAHKLSSSARHRKTDLVVAQTN